MKPHTPEFDARAREIKSELYENLRAQYHDPYLADTNFDYAYGETPVIDAYCDDLLQCDEMTEERFNAIEAALNTLQENKFNGFKITAMLSDLSGWAYWSTEGNPLMIMVTAEITDIEAIDGNDLCEAFVTLGNKVHDIVTGEST